MRASHDLPKLLCTLLLLLLFIAQGTSGSRRWIMQMGGSSSSSSSRRSSGGGGGGGGMQKRSRGHGDVVMAEVIHARRLQAAPYCVAIAGADETKLQDGLDWACGSGSGQGNVDCSAILQTGSCYNPNTLQGHASYAFNYYYVKEGGSSGSCDFNGVATTSSTDPSSGSCVYPSLSAGISSPTSSNGNSTIGSPPSDTSTNGTSITGTTSNAPNLTIAISSASLLTFAGILFMSSAFPIGYL